MISGPFRLPLGGRVDRAREVRFTLDGKTMKGLQGDTLASALLANGITLVGRSFKYHRPRGFLSAGVEEPNGLLTLGDGGRPEPNVPATVTELREGLAARRQNAWPSVKIDLRAVNSWVGPLLGAGFYYKTFMGPTRGAWWLYERFIRGSPHSTAPDSIIRRSWARHAAPGCSMSDLFAERRAWAARCICKIPIATRHATHSRKSSSSARARPDSRRPSRPAPRERACCSSNRTGSSGAVYCRRASMRRAVNGCVMSKRGSRHCRTSRSCGERRPWGSTMGTRWRLSSAAITAGPMRRKARRARCW